MISLLSVEPRLATQCCAVGPLCYPGHSTNHKSTKGSNIPHHRCRTSMLCGGCIHDSKLSQQVRVHPPDMTNGVQGSSGALLMSACEPLTLDPAQASCVTPAASQAAAAAVATGGQAAAAGTPAALAERGDGGWLPVMTSLCVGVVLLGIILVPLLT